MIKETPNPPEAEPDFLESDPGSPYVGFNSKKLHDAALRALDHYLAPPAKKQAQADRRSSTIFVISPSIDTETLLAHTCETLASLNVMASDLAFDLQGPSRSTALAIQQMVSLAELAVNRMLDNVEPAV